MTAQVIEYASYMAEKEPKDLAQIYLDYAAKYLHTDTTLDQAYKNKFGIELDEEQVNQRQHRRTRKRKGPAGRFHPAGHIYAIPSALQPH